MSDGKVLFVATDGLDVRFLDWLEHPMWEHMRDHAAIAEVPEPEEITAGKAATASSPRLWAPMYTGVPPTENGILGFWEKRLPDGRVVALDKSKEWVKENRCEKGVHYLDLLVPPLWELVMEAGLSVGSVAAWFTWPLTEEMKALIDATGSWVLTDFPFPMDHPHMERRGFFWPDAPDMHPGEDFQEEAGSGMRVQTLKHRDPEGYFEMLLKQDADRYDYMARQLEQRGTPDLGMIMTRSVDGTQHQYRQAADLDYVAEHLQDGTENLRRIYELNLEGVQRLWESGDWDHLIWCGDHGTSLTFDDAGDIAHMEGPAHNWPAYTVWFSDREPVPAGSAGEADYVDVPATILDLLGLERPDWHRGKPIINMAATAERLEKLGYM